MGRMWGRGAVTSHSRQKSEFGVSEKQPRLSACDQHIWFTSSFSPSIQHIAKYLQAEAVKKDRLDFHEGWKGYFKMVGF